MHLKQLTTCVCVCVCVCQSVWSVTRGCSVEVCVNRAQVCCGLHTRQKPLPENHSKHPAATPISLSIHLVPSLSLFPPSPSFLSVSFSLSPSHHVFCYNHLFLFLSIPKLFLPLTSSFLYFSPSPSSFSLIPVSFVLFSLTPSPLKWTWGSTT